MIVYLLTFSEEATSETENEKSVFNMHTHTILYVTWDLKFVIENTRPKNCSLPVSLILFISCSGALITSLSEAVLFYFPFSDLCFFWSSLAVNSVSFALF